MTSPNDTPTPLPACCIPTADATVAERLYCAYNAAGPDGLRGLNHLGLPCPAWSELPEQIRRRWDVVAWRAMSEVGTLTAVNARLARAVRFAPEPEDRMESPFGMNATVTRVWCKRDPLWPQWYVCYRTDGGTTGEMSLTAWSSAPSETKWLAREARLLPRPPDPVPEVDQLLSEFVDVLHTPDDLEPEDAARLTARIAELRASIVSLVMRHRPNDG